MSNRENIRLIARAPFLFVFVVFIFKTNMSVVWPFYYLLRVSHAVLFHLCIWIMAKLMQNRGIFHSCFNN